MPILSGGSSPQIPIRSQTSRISLLIPLCRSRTNYGTTPNTVAGNANLPRYVGKLVYLEYLSWPSSDRRDIKASHNPSSATLATCDYYTSTRYLRRGRPRRPRPVEGLRRILGSIAGHFSFVHRRESRGPNRQRLTAT